MKGEGSMNIEVIVVMLLVAAFYGGIAFLIWKNRKQRAASTKLSESEFEEMAHRSESEETIRPFEEGEAVRVKVKH
jgi:cytoskeletal protein RodZ